MSSNVFFSQGCLHLLKASSKKVVDQIFVEIFKNRVGEIPMLIKDSLMSALLLNEAQVIELVESIRYLEKVALYENSSNLDSFFPASFHKDLKGLILQIIGSHLSLWRQDCIDSLVSLPKLQSIDWRIDIKRASETMTNMSIPTVLVQLELEDNLNSKVFSIKTEKLENRNDSKRSVIFELNKQTLETMIDGLGKIKEQLATLK